MFQSCIIVAILLVTYYENAAEFSPEEKCGRPNEVYSTCIFLCPPQTCESLDSNTIYSCPLQLEDEGEGSRCESGCVCKDGFYRNKLKECIAKEDCLKCMGPSEYFSCGVECDNVCETLNEQSQDNCPVNTQCKKICYCDLGYARNISNICIPIEECLPSTPSTDSTEPSMTENITEARARLDQGSIDFTNEILYKLISSKPNENIVASGTSVLIPLALLSLYTKDVVQEQLFKLLSLNNKDEIKAVFSESSKEYNNRTYVTLEVVNKIYVKEGYQLTDPFKSDAKEHFSTEAENLDFSQNEVAAETINNWVNIKTSGKIKDLISPSALNEDIKLVVVSAIYFLGNWITQFDREDTETKNFTKSNGDIVQVEMMHQQNSLIYAESYSFQALQLPYKGNSFSFLVILPTSNDGLLTALDYLKDPATFADLLESMTYEKVQVYLPKFEINLDIDMAEILKEINLTAIFRPDNDGFDGILQKSEPLIVSGVFQKAFVIINENGAEAGADTGITFATPFPEEIHVFDASRPFAFYILLDNIPLFCGAFLGA